MFHVPGRYRIRKGPLASDVSFGNNGAFEIPFDGDIIAYVIASDGEGWEHVSVHMVDDGKQETPTWGEMCIIKAMFWDKDDCVIQYHPPESDYVNNHEHVLHLWRPINKVMPTPPSIMVGLKTTALMTTTSYVSS